MVQDFLKERKEVTKKLKVCQRKIHYFFLFFDFFLNSTKLKIFGLFYQVQFSDIEQMYASKKQRVTPQYLEKPLSLCNLFWTKIQNLDKISRE
jgi:hypothetical protein